MSKANCAHCNSHEISDRVANGQHFCHCNECGSEGAPAYSLSNAYRNWNVRVAGSNKQCPHCGGQANIVLDAISGNRYRCICTCGAKGPITNGKESAWELWEKRPEVSDEVARLGSLVAIEYYDAYGNFSRDMFIWGVGSAPSFPLSGKKKDDEFELKTDFPLPSGGFQSFGETEPNRVAKGVIHVKVVNVFTPGLKQVFMVYPEYEPVHTTLQMADGFTHEFPNAESSWRIIRGNHLPLKIYYSTLNQELK